MDAMEERVAILEQSLKALHKRNDVQDELLAEIKTLMLTVEGMEARLTAQFNAGIAKGLWAAIKWGLAIGAAGLTAWVIHYFGFNKGL